MDRKNSGAENDCVLCPRLRGGYFLSVIFLLLNIVHTVTYRKMLGVKRWLLLGLILISFATGLFGMILDQFPIVLILHRVISVVLVFFLAIHIFMFHKKLH